MRLQPARWLAAAAGDWLIIVAVFWIFAALGTPLVLVPIAALLIGARQHALGILGHDGAHFLAFRNRRWNDFFTRVLTAWPLLVSIAHGYRPWHFDHHRTLGTDADPELKYRRAGVYRDQPTWMKIAVLYVGDLLGFGLFNAFGFWKRVRPRRRLQALGPPLALGTIITIGFIELGLWWVPALWAWSLFTGFYAAFRVRTFTEHVAVPWSGKYTSHRFAAGWLTRFLFFPHNTFCHYEHHKWPQVPCYNLPRLRNLDTSKPILRLRDLFPIVASPRRVNSSTLEEQKRTAA